MEALQAAQQLAWRLAPVKATCTSFVFSPRQRPWLFRLRKSPLLRCAAHKEHRRRDLLQAGIVLGGMSMLQVHGSAATEMPQVPKAELAPELAISQVRYKLNRTFSPSVERRGIIDMDVVGCKPLAFRCLCPCKRWAAVQVIKGCWQLSGGHG